MRPGALQAVLFDMDGLLVDTEPLWFEAERTVMARLGGVWTPADQRALLGRSMSSATSYFLSRAARPASAAQVADWLIGEMARLVADRGAPPLPGATELVAQVRAAGIPAGLVTSSERVIMDAVLASLANRGLRLDTTVCRADVRNPKPHPEPYLLAAAKLGADPQRCAALEDSATGAASAQAAGCAVVIVPSFDSTGLDRFGPVVPALTSVNLAMLAALVARHSPQKPHQEPA
jgi:HAD superfamily hydrolase (TIGR01509 family)